MALFFNFNLENIQWWKLNTADDWFQFMSLVIPSFLVLFAYYRVTVRSRSEAAAVDRVNRRFKRYAEKDAHIYKNVGLRIGEHEIVVDNLAVDKHGILMGHTFGRGLSAYGEPKDEFWRIKDNESNELVSNPLYEVDQIVHARQTTLAGHDIYGANVEGAAIFADNFNEPTLFVGQSANAFSIKYVKRYFEKRNQGKVLVKDPSKVAQALEKYFFEVPPKENYSQRKQRIKREKRERRQTSKAARAGK